MADDKIRILVEAEVAKALGNLDALQKKTEEVAKPTLFEKMKANWLALSAASAGAIVAIKKAFDFTKEFAEFQDSANAMADQFGLNANEVIKTMKAASGGMLSMRDSIVMVNKAFGMGVTDKVEDVGKLFKIAEARADAFGLSGKEAFDKLVESIGKGSPRGLKELGLLEGGMKKYKDAQEGTIDKQELLNDVLTNFNDLATSNGPLSLADKIDVIGSALEDLRLAAGKGISIIIGGAMEGNLGWIDKVQRGIIGLAIIVRTNFSVIASAVQLFLTPLWAMADAVVMVGKLTYEQFKLMASVATFDKKGMQEAMDNMNRIAEEGGKSIKKEFSDAWNDVAARAKEAKRSVTDLWNGNLVEDQGGLKPKKLEPTEKGPAAAIKTPQAKEWVQDFITATNSIEAELREAQERMNDEQEKLADKAADKAKERFEIRAKSMEQIAQAAGQFMQDISNFMSQMSDQRIADLEEERTKALETNGSVRQYEALLEQERQQSYNDLVTRRDEARAAGDAETEADLNNQIAMLDAERAATEEKARINDKFDKAVRKEKHDAAVREKAFGIFQATIDAALGVAKAAASAPPPWNIPLIALASAAGLTQIAAVSAAPIPALAKGGSLVTDGPQLFLAGENASGKERIDVTPLNADGSPSGNGSQRKVEYHFHGIQNLREARNELMRREGTGAFQ